MKKIIIIAGFWLIILPAFSQKNITSEDAIRVALENSPTLKAANFEVQARRFSEKTARRLANPELNIESPTGNFYAVGVSQNFDFPTVYRRQKQVARAETSLAEAAKKMDENELRLAVRTAYLETQIADFQLNYEMQRDSMYQNITAVASRQFTAGEIDFLQKTLVENEAGGVHQKRLAAQAFARAAHRELELLTGISDIENLQPLTADSSGVFFEPDFSANPSVVYQNQAAQLASEQIGLAKSRALPNFSLGYLNQGERSTLIDYRFRASIAIPIWGGQYRSTVKSAQAKSEAAAANAEAKNRQISIEIARAKTEMAVLWTNLQYLNREALPRSRAITAAATRMREAGQIDYASFLRTLDGALSTSRELGEQIRAFETARIYTLFLQGRN